MKLIKIPEEKYSDYRYEVIFSGYKWDPQVIDSNTVSEYALVMDKEEMQTLAQLAEQLAQETMAMEEKLIGRIDIHKKLGFPYRMRRAMKKLKTYQPEQHVRLMRYDFHWTNKGWQISEVNSDVPGGFAESSVLPKIAADYLSNVQPPPHFGEHLYQAFHRKIASEGTIGFVHATSYSDDRQVMQFMGDYFEEQGYEALYLAPDHVTFKERTAYSLLNDERKPLAGLIRFFPLEWLPNLPFSVKWSDYYDTITPSCNHPAAMLTQPKSLPLFWDELGVDCPTWRKLLPETQKVRSLDFEDSIYLYKPVFGRVGSGITIKEVMKEKEFEQVKKLALRHKKEWIVQQRFDSLPFDTLDGLAFHLCIGAFTIEGRFAGFYGRISPNARIDEEAKDIPILIQKERTDGLSIEIV